MRYSRYVFSLLALMCATSAAMAAESMQAAVIVDGKVVVRIVPRPEPQPGEVRVRIMAAGVNPVDWRTALGRPVAAGIGAGSNDADRAAAILPRPSLGYDGAGVIDAIGTGVTAWKAGEEVVVWTPRRGTYAEYAVVNVSTEGIARKPPDISFEEGAGFGHAAVAAWSMLVDVAKVQSGQRVLILGGSGGVGTVAIQIARNRGAYVIATASTRNQELMRSLGADETLDYTLVNFWEELKYVDAAFNTVDVNNANRAVGVVRPGGFLVSLVGLPPADDCAARVITCALRMPTGAAGATPVNEVLRQLTDWAVAGKLKIHVDRTFTLNDVSEAWAHSQAGRTRGKVIIRVGS